MKIRACLVACTLAAGLVAACATPRPERPARAYRELPAVTDPGEFLRWLELRRSIAVEVDGLAPDSPEVRTQDRTIIATAEFWARRRRAELAAARKSLLAKGLGENHAHVMALAAEETEVAERLADVRRRYGRGR